MLCFVFAVSLCVCLSVCGVCLGGICVHANACAFKFVPCLRLFARRNVCAFVFFFFCLSFVRLLLVYIQMKTRVFLFLLYPRTEEGRIWCLGWWSSLENSVSVSAEKANWEDRCTGRQRKTHTGRENVEWECIWAQGDFRIFGLLIGYSSLNIDAFVMSNTPI